MGQKQTPGVSSADANAFPASLAPVATAVAAFVGHTEKVEHHGQSLVGRPWRITSMAEYEQVFGAAPTPRFEIRPSAGSPDESPFVVGGEAWAVRQLDGKEGGRYLLFPSIRLFFENGGGACYVVSVGDYQSDPTREAFEAGIEALASELEPASLAVPDAVLLTRPECVAVQQAMLRHCGGRMRSRVAILDLWEGWRSEPESGCVANFRSALGDEHLDYAVAYYPWVRATPSQANDPGLENLAPASRGVLGELIEKASGAACDPALVAASPLFGLIRKAMSDHLNVLPPSGAIAGVYAMVDSSVGVWHAPANVSLSGVASPAVNVTSAEQEWLNLDAGGKSINALRSFVGRGVLVWGARTLNGNSAELRFIHVRRTMIMLERSCVQALNCFVFEPNTSATWVTLRGLLEQFLTGMWSAGGLMGAAPEEAFSVQVGLGQTMTPADILDGILRVTVRVAVARPAEFLEFTIEQTMQAA